MQTKVPAPADNIRDHVSVKDAAGKENPSTGRIADHRASSVGQLRRIDVIHNSPRSRQAAALQTLAHDYSGRQLQAHAYAQGTDIHLGPGQEQHLPHDPSIQALHGAMVGAEIVQAKGFNRVNDKPISEIKADTPEKTIADAGLSAWTPVFTNSAIDGKGGVIATYRHEAKEIDADAETLYEKPILHEAFGQVNLVGDLAMGTNIDRWSAKDVESEEAGELVFKPETVKTEIGQVREVISVTLDGGTPEADAEEDRSDITLNGFIKPMRVWCAENPSRKAELVGAIYDFLHATLTERKGAFTSSMFDLMGVDDDDEDPFPKQLFERFKTTFHLTGKTEKKNAPSAVALSLEEVIMHEFGHIHAALLTTKDSIEKSKNGFSPNLKSALSLATILRNEGPPAREQLSAWRFAWSHTRTEWYKIKDLEQDLALQKKITDAIDTMQNILMAFEEYMNIMDIDNKKAQASQHGMRLRHGTEIRTGLAVGVDLKANERSLANQPAVREAEPHAMADRVWRDKLTMLLDAYLEKYAD